MSAAGEAPGVTLLRELQEEVGLDFHTSLPPVVDDKYNNNNLPLESQLTDPESVVNINAIPLQQNERKTKHSTATILKSYQQSKPSGNRLNYLGMT